VLEEAAGRRLCDCSVAEIKSALPEIVSFIAPLRSLTFPYYGEIVGDFAAIGNHNLLDDYVDHALRYWARELEAHLSNAWRVAPGIRDLLIWLGSVLERPRGAEAAVVSCLSSKSCFCHSDIKVTDMFVDERNGCREYTLLDFDNVFAFVPEFDLCKLHFNLFEHGIDMSLELFCEMIARQYRVELTAIIRSFMSVYLFALTLMLNWSSKRGHEDLIAHVECMVTRILAAQAQAM
jgi:hypothetical protein